MCAILISECCIDFLYSEVEYNVDKNQDLRLSRRFDQAL